MTYQEKFDAIRYAFKDKPEELTYVLHNLGFRLIISGVNDGSCWESIMFMGGEGICVRYAPNDIPNNHSIIDSLFQNLAQETYQQKRLEFLTQQQNET